MNGFTTYFWFVWGQEVWADITVPRPDFAQEQLPPPDLPPYLFPWSTVWIIIPFVLIVLALVLRVQKKKYNQNAADGEPQESSI